MSAERILNRLEVYQRQLSARIEVVARIVELGGRPAWEYFAHDLDAAINDIRGMLAEPVKCQRCSGLGRILSMTGPYAEEVCRVCDGTGRYPDAQGGTDAK